MLISSLSFALVNLCVKLLTNAEDATELLGTQIQQYPVHELVLFRAIISLSISIFIIKMKGIPFFGNNKKWLILRGVFGVTSLTMFFYTLQNLPIAIATMVQYISPVFTIVLSIFLLGEKVKPVQWMFFAVSMAGVAVIGYSRDGSIDFEISWLLLGVFSAIISGLAYNSIMMCRNTDEPITVVMYFPLIATPVMFIACLAWGYVIPQGIEWLLLLIIGILTQIAQVSMTKGFNSDAAARVTPVKYTGAIYALLIGFFIFDETLGLWSSLGISLILSGVLLNTFLSQKKIRLKILPSRHR